MLGTWQETPRQVWEVGTTIPIYNGGNWGSGTLRIMPKGPQVIKPRTGGWAQALWL